MPELDPTQFGLAFDGLYEAAVAPELWPSALDRLSRAAGGIVATITIAPSIGGGGVTSPGWDDCFQTWFDEGWYADVTNPRWINGRKANLAGHGAFTDEMIFASGELERSRIQNEFFGKFGLRNYFGFDYGPGLMLGTIERGFHPVAASELEVVRQFVPHFRRIGQLARARGLGIADGAVAALDAVDAGAIIVDHAGRVLRMNTRGEDLCGSALTICGGIMRPRCAGARAGFERMVLHAASPHATQDLDFINAVPLPREVGRPLLAEAIPLKGAAEDVFQQAKAIVILTDPDERTSVVARIVRMAQAFGMTRSETRVAARLVHGDAIPDIAEALAISPGTVRTHLKSLFLKTGTHRQAELAALLGRIF